MIQFLTCTNLTANVLAVVTIRLVMFELGSYIYSHFISLDLGPFW